MSQKLKITIKNKTICADKPKIALKNKTICADMPKEDVKVICADKSKEDTLMKRDEIMKKCTGCGDDKLRTEFYKHGGKCKECVKAEQKIRNKEIRRRDEMIKKDPQLRQIPKSCPGCGREKTLYDFQVGRGKCNECEKKRGREYNHEHPEIRQKWTDDHPERHRELKANWYQRNKPHIRAKYTSRYNSDEQFKISRLLKSQILSKIHKLKSTEEYTGTDIESVACWFQYNFTPEMTWDNHGTEWDIDHVIPVTRWDLSNPEQVDLCFNWKNLSPLNSKYNRHDKSNTIDMAQVTRHKQQLRQYFTENNLDDTELTQYLEKYDQQLISLGETP